MDDSSQGDGKSDKQLGKRVDKLGRVRPKSYSQKKNLPKKAKSDLSADKPKFVESQSQVMSDDDESYYKNYEEGMDEPPNIDETVQRLIEEAIFNTEDDDSDLISNEKWHELMDLPETLADDDSTKNESDYVETEKKEISETDEFDRNSTIYHGHHMTIYTSMVLILLYSMCHSISGAQLSDLLTMISLHCLNPHPGLKSMYTFKRFFTDLQSPMKKHFYCSTCFCDVTVNEDVCPNEKCQQQLSLKKKSYFIEIPVKHQVKTFLEKKGTLESLKHRFTRKKKKSVGIEDIYDGNLYRNLSKTGGPLSEENPYNLSFTWNTDGIPIFKSSKVSIWPLYLTVNELPVKQRMQTENMILYGLWFGESKPFMGGFTKPLIHTLRDLETNGTDFTINGQIYNSKSYLICGTADLPAKSLVMNCNQFNGQYSCLRCLHSGETFRTVKGGTVRTFPYDRSKPQPRKRTSQECMSNAVEAVNSRSVINGMKGPSFLMTLKYYDFVKSSSIDYMHGVLLGVTKVLINLWTSGSNSKERFSISSNISIIDDRLKRIKPPSYITRVPRTISSHIKYWKASELRTWLFFYSLPILCDILDEKYFHHFASFVEGIYLLCTDCITPEDLEKSKILLSYFVHMFSSMYGERYVTLNMHSLLHLPECVEDLGPLWVYSCFPYENANGLLTELFHGTQNIELQIISSLNIVQKMPFLLHPIEDSVHKAFAAKMQRTSEVSQNYTGTLSGSMPVGSNIKMHFSDDIYAQLISTVQFKPSKSLCYRRICLRGFTIHSEAYSRVSVRNTFTVKYYESESKMSCYGSILYYIHAKKCECFENICSCESSLVAVLRKFEETKPSIVNPNFLSVKASHIKVTKISNTVSVVDSSKIMSVVVNVNIDDKSEDYFLCEVPNLKESD
eukprot:XP_019922889.1 PREDICTED: uncharacterized protein LOC105328585 [Crassostrea gigas]